MSLLLVLLALALLTGVAMHAFLSRVLSMMSIEWAQRTHATLPIVEHVFSMPTVLQGAVMEERARQLVGLGFVETGVLAERVGGTMRFYRCFYHAASHTHASVTRGLWFPTAVFRSVLADGTLVCTVEGKGPLWRGDPRLQRAYVDESSQVQLQRHTERVLALGGVVAGEGTTALAAELIRLEGELRYGTPGIHRRAALSSDYAPVSLGVERRPDRLDVDIRRRKESFKSTWIGRGLAALFIVVISADFGLETLGLEIAFFQGYQAFGVALLMLAGFVFSRWLESRLKVTVHNARIDAVVTGWFAQKRRIALDDLSAVSIDGETLVLSHRGSDRGKDLRIADYGSDVELAWITDVIGEALTRHRANTEEAEAPEKAPDELRQMLLSAQQAKQRTDY